MMMMMISIWRTSTAAERVVRVEVAAAAHTPTACSWRGQRLAVALTTRDVTLVTARSGLVARTTLAPANSSRPHTLSEFSPVWARQRCRVSPPRFLAECCKRQLLNQGSFVLLYFRLSSFSNLYWVCLSVFSCTVLFVSISQVIGCEDHPWNDL